MTGRRRGLFSALLPALLGACFSSQAMMAPPRDSAPTYLWGIHKACRRDAYLSSAVEKRLFQLSSPTGGEVRRLLPGSTIENAPAKLGVTEFLRTCRFSRTIAPQSGVLLGGRVEERGAAPPFVVMRLFRVELGTQKFAYRDHFCRGCDIARTLATQAAFLLESPGSAAAEPPARPTFCTAAPPPPRAAIAPNLDAERVSLSLRGSGVGKALGPHATPTKLLEALRQHVLSTGRDVVPANAYYTLTVELRADGGADVRIASRSGRGEGLTIARPKSAAGAVAEGISESITDQVVRAAGRLLDGAVANEAAASGQTATSLFELPLPQATFAALCQAAPIPDCASTAGVRLDSDPTLSPFLEPHCGELLEQEPEKRR